MSDSGGIAGKPGGMMTLAGLLLVVAGIVCSIVAWRMQTAVAPEPLSAEEIVAGAVLPETVMNIGLMQEQMMMLYCGLAAALAGFMLMAAGAIVGAIRSPVE